MSLAGQISSSEVRDLLLSLVALVIAFTVMIGGRSIPGIDTIMIITTGVSTGFLLHELAHKFMALRLGYRAEYRANIAGLILAIVLSFGGFLFAAPGAVMIQKSQATMQFYMQDPIGLEEQRRTISKETLWISLAGPMTNIVLAILFFLTLLFVDFSNEVASRAAGFCMTINLTLAAFNLLPFGPLDGKKIFDSNRMVWFLVGIPTILVALPVYFGL